MQKFSVYGSLVDRSTEPDDRAAVYLACDVDARIAELEMQLAEAKGHIETLDRSNDRLRQKLDRLSS